MSDPSTSLKSKQHSHLSSGSGFIQLKSQYISNWIELNSVSPSALSLWLWLLKHSDRLNRAHLTEQQIIAGVPVSRATLYRNCKLLEERHWIERRDKIIHLNAAIVWRGVKPGTQALAVLNCPPVIPRRNDLPASFDGTAPW